MFLLDTVVVSEIRKKKPDAGVLRCVSKQKADRLFLNVVTLGEIERGIEKRRKANPGLTDGLVAWLESMTRLYADRVLPVTPGIARRWGPNLRTIGARRRRSVNRRNGARAWPHRGNPQ